MIRLGSASYRTFQWRVRHSCLTAGAWKSQSHGHLSHNDEFHVGHRLPTGTATPVHERCEWREWATRRHKRGPLRQGHMWMCGRRDHGVRVGWHDLTDIAAAPFVVGASCDRDQPQQPSRGPEGRGGRGGGEGEGERYRDDAGVRWAPCLGSDCHTQPFRQTAPQGVYVSPGRQHLVETASRLPPTATVCSATVPPRSWRGLRLFILCRRSGGLLPVANPCP